MTNYSKAEKHVYFMRPVGMVGPIKIGCSAFLDERLIQMSIWSPFPLEIIHTLNGGHALERNLHKCFADCHSHHEWFFPTKRLLDAIKRLKNGEALSDVVDLSDTRGSIQNQNRPPVAPVMQGYRSYRMKVIWAEKGAKKSTGELMWIPSDGEKIMRRWEGEWLDNNRRAESVRPTDAEFARLDEIVSDPIRHCETRSQHFQKPKSVAA